MNEEEIIKRIKTMKYKVGDRVKIKSLDWYNENKDNNREIKFENGIFTTLKSTFLGQIMTIEEITLEKQYILMEDRYKTLWTDEMIEGLVEEENVHNKWTGLKVELELSKTVIGVSNVESIQGERFMSGFVKAIIPPEGYQFKDENGNIINAQKIVLEKKNKYPKTYEECCEIMNVIMETEIVADAYLERLDDYELNLDTKIENLRKLLICRDAYWKIAGEEMGLGKPWAPDWANQKLSKYCIASVEGRVINAERYIVNTILTFPTIEMRGAFKENFDADIEFCKELL